MEYLGSKNKCKIRKACNVREPLLAAYFFPFRFQLVALDTTNQLIKKITFYPLSHVAKKYLIK